MSDLVSQNLNMIFKSPKGETVHALKDLNFTIKKGELLGFVNGPFAQFHKKIKSPMHGLKTKRMSNTKVHLT